MATIGKTFTFEAAHRLRYHNGLCRNLHGHSYRIEVSIRGEIQNYEQGEEFDLSVQNETEGEFEKIKSSTPNPQGGMVLDFGQLNKWWKTVESSLDHKTLLEDSDPLGEILGRALVSVTLFEEPPTAENLATWLRENLQNWIIETNALPTDFGFFTPSVRVYETAKSWAEA